MPFSGKNLYLLPRLPGEKVLLMTFYAVASKSRKNGHLKFALQPQFGYSCAQNFSSLCDLKSRHKHDSRVKLLENIASWKILHIRVEAFEL